MNKRNAVLLVAGVALLLIGILGAAIAPGGANSDAASSLEEPDNGHIFNQFPSFYQAHLYKRFIVSGLFGLTGICLITVAGWRLTANDKFEGKHCELNETRSTERE